MDFSQRRLPPFKFVGQWSQDDPADDVEEHPTAGPVKHYSCIMPERNRRDVERGNWPFAIGSRTYEELEAICIFQARRLSGIFTPPPPPPERPVANKTLERLKRSVEFQRGKLDVAITAREDMRVALLHSEARERDQRDVIARLKEKLSYAEDQLEKLRTVRLPEIDFVRCGPKISMPRYNGMVGCRIFPTDSGLTDCKTFTITMRCHETRQNIEFGVRRGQVVLLLEGVDFPDQLERGPFPSPESHLRAKRVALPPEYEI